ncbi:MAG: M23 family metallopeptidase [candidate division WOR-3 bacterium]
MLLPLADTLVQVWQDGSSGSRVCGCVLVLIEPQASLLTLLLQISLALGFDTSARGSTIIRQEACLKKTVAAVLLLVLPVLLSAVPWPIPPVDRVHPLGNNWGNYQDYGGGAYFHNGIDVITPDTAGAEVRAVAPGWVKAWGTIQQELHYRVAVCDSPLSYTGRAPGWLYAHIDPQRPHKNVGDSVRTGDLIGYLVDWPINATFDHCHFARISDTGATWMRFPNVTWWFIENPLLSIRPNTDLLPPVFENARSGARFAFCRDNTNNSYLDPTRLTGDVDIIAKIYDKTGFSTGNATWDKLAPYQIEHMIRRTDGLVIRPWTLSVQFSNRLDAANVHVVYKNDNTCNSYGDYDRREYYYIVTNTDGDSIIEAGDTQGKWATAGVGDADYWVIVRASDIAGNTTVDSMRVTTANGVPIAAPTVAVLKEPLRIQQLSGARFVVRFSLMQAGEVRLSIFDNCGRLVSRLCDGSLDRGDHSLEFSPDAEGVYLVELETAGMRQTGKAVAIR